MMPPSTMAASSGNQQPGNERGERDGQYHLRAAKPNTVMRMVIRRGRLNSSPMENIRNTTPNSAR